MDVELLKDLSQYQARADAQHWKAVHGNAALLDDAQIRKRLNHIVRAAEMLSALARGEAPDVAKRKERESIEELEAAMGQANEALATALGSVDLDKMITLPLGPNGPFQAPAGVLLLQALMHGQHHRGQNASRMRELGVIPPMADFLAWHALGRPGQ